MGNKLYVGNLRFTVTDESLKDLFTPFGTVQSAKIITDRYSGLSKGFGFVEMNSESEAAEAIEKMNGKEFDGRTLTVSEARPQTPREDGGGFRGGPVDRGAAAGEDGLPSPEAAISPEIYFSGITATRIHPTYSCPDREREKRCFFDPAKGLRSFSLVQGRFGPC